MTDTEEMREIEKPPLGKYHSKNDFKQDLDSLEKTLTLGKTEGRRRRGWTENDSADSTEMSLSKLWGVVKDKEARSAAVHGGRRVRHNCATEQPPPND